MHESATAGELARDVLLPAAAIILADDLIWSSRLAAGLRALGVAPTVVAGLAPFERSLSTADHAVIDLTARAYDGLEAVSLAAAAGAVVLCVAQHDDAELRRAALAVGARRVVPYRTMFERGPETLRRWLSEPATQSVPATPFVPATPAVPATRAEPSTPAEPATSAARATPAGTGAR